MKADFLGWYEGVALSADPNVADARWTAVQSLAASANQDELEALIRAAFRAKSNASKTAAVRAKLAGQGAAIQDEEFKLLAAVTLALMLRTNQPGAARAAIMISTTHLDGLRPVKQPVDIINAATSTRFALAQTTRRRPTLTTTAVPELEVDPTEAVESADQDERLQLLATACTTIIKSLAQRQSQFEQEAKQYFSIQDEELNMLWWLQGGHSPTLNQSFAKIPREQRPFILARELAAVTYAVPGVAAIESLLARAGVDEGELQISAAVQSLPLDWLAAAIPDADAGKVSPVTTPLHEAFKRRLEVNGQDTWISNWASVCEIDPAAKLSALHLADFCYCEQLVILK